MKCDNKQLDVFMARDRIKSFSEFLPDKKLHKEYNNVVITRRSDRCAFLFMSSDFRECEMTVLVENKSTLCSPLTCFAYKSGIRVPLGTILNPNNGLSSYSQFYAVVHTCFNYKIPLDKVLKKVVTVLQAQETEDKKKGKKIDFIINNLKLLVNKNFTVKDYCFAVGSFPHCNYQVLREYLVLPSRRKLQAVVSSVNVKDILSKTFAKLQKPQQKNVVLSSSSSSFEGHPLQARHKQNWGRGFILLLPQTAALPESDAGSDVIKPASSFVIQNRQTACSM